MPNTRRPAAVVVSTCARRRQTLPRPTPRADRSCAVSTRWRRFRSRRSSFQTTLTPPFRRVRRQLSSPGRPSRRSRGEVVIDVDPRRRRPPPGHRAAGPATAGRRSSRWRTASGPAHSPGGLSKLPPCNPPSSTGRTTLPEPHPPDADQGGPDRARERRGPHCIRSVRRGPRAGLPARRFGGVPPPPAPCSRPCQVERFGLHAQSSNPPPAGPGTAVRPRDRRRTPALAMAHPAGLNRGPARRVRLSQIPASRTAPMRSIGLCGVD